ncbi:YdcF family protein [Methylacidimicrobium tartarophylax]|nr:YdcF family protein [Methylacidimicrobium tartarophylax]
METRGMGNLGPPRSAAAQRLFPRRRGNRPRQRWRCGNPELGSFFLGADGLWMLALSVFVGLASATLSFWLVFGHVLRIARRTPSSIDSPFRIVVLGSCLDADGGPTPTYRCRLDRALRLYRQAPSAKIVLLGGTTLEGGPSEAMAGSRYLLAHGLPERSLILEENSRHTLENLHFYRSTLASTDGRPDALVTSRFHLARSTLLASGLRIPHAPCAAEDCWAASPQEILRLFVEAFFVHWYLVGRTYARWTRNERMLDRIR